MQQGQQAFLFCEWILHPPNNDAIHNTVQIIKHVMSSAMEAELRVLFINTKQATIMGWMLEEVGQMQPPTSIQTDNSAAYGITNKSFPRQPKQWIHISTGWATMNNRNNSDFLVTKILITSTTGPSFTQWHITNSFKPSSWWHHTALQGEWCIQGCTVTWPKQTGVSTIRADTRVCWNSQNS